MTSTFISIIIPAYNEHRYISDCLGALVSQDYPGDRYEIIVVDNHSKDKTKEIALSFDVKVIQQKSGPVGAVRNAGVKQAKGEFLAFIDADCVASTDWLSKGVKLLLNDDYVYGGDYRLRVEPPWVEKAWLLENKHPPKDLLGGCIFIRKKDFLLIGSFDEHLTSGEDTKLSVSLRNKNYHIKVVPALDVIHLGNPITLKEFFYRQIWHSENYFQNWEDTKRDPTFYLIIIFIVSGSLVISIFAKTSYIIFFISLIVFLITPLLFTLKRLWRSKSIAGNLRKIPLMYILDLIYLTGRSIGLTKSLLHTLKASLGETRARKTR